jgi:elongation factor G
LEARKSLRRVNPSILLGSGGGVGKKSKSKVERPSGLLELMGGKMDMIEGDVQSGEVCAIVGLKDVETGDTLVLQGGGLENVCLEGVSAPKPVLTVRWGFWSAEDLPGIL